MKSVCKHTESRKTAALHVKAKVDEKMKTRRRKNYLSLDDSVLSSIVNEGKRRAEVTGVPGVPRTATSPRRKRVATPYEFDGVVPANGKVFTLKEAI